MRVLSPELHRIVRWMPFWFLKLYDMCQVPNFTATVSGHQHDELVACLTLWEGFCPFTYKRFNMPNSLHMNVILEVSLNAGTSQVNHEDWSNSIELSVCWALPIKGATTIYARGEYNFNLFYLYFLWNNMMSKPSLFLLDMNSINTHKGNPKKETHWSR